MNTEVYPAELKLIDGPTTVTLRPRNANAGNPIACKEWDLGAPEVRIQFNPLPGTDGVQDGAGFLGARTVTFDLQILGGKSPDDGQVHDAYWYAQTLTAMTHPTRRPTLTVSRAGGIYAGQLWSMALRGNPFSLTYGRRAAALLELQLAFTAPGGVLEGPLQSRSGSPGGDTGDWTFPVAFPASFGTSDFINPVIEVPVGGTAAVSPIVYIAGPVNNPKLVTDDRQVFAFTGLSLGSGQSVQIDMAAGSVLRASSGLADITEADSVYHLVDWAQSTFWRWLPGTHLVRYVGNGGTATVQWRDRQLTI